MDNITHSLIGLTAAKAGLDKLSPGATTLCALAANSPDGDILALIFGGRWTYLQQHRGISHSIVGVCVLALALPLIFYFGDLLLARTRKHGRRVKLPGLLLASAVVTATHPLMDWANNYGVRFLLPWNPRWFYGDFIFVIDPFIWVVLGGAAFLLTAKTRKQLIAWGIIALFSTLLVLVGLGPMSSVRGIALRLLWIIALLVLVNLYQRNFGARAGAKLAITALATIVIYCSALAATHFVALRRANLQAITIANDKAEKFIRVAAMPTVANPAEWLCVMETDRATYRFKLSLLAAQAGDLDLVRYEKPDGSDAQIVAQATRDSRSHAFLGFARFPVVHVIGEDCATQTLVQFADLRYTEPGKGRGTFSLDVPVECPVPEEPNK
jgi:inner membrane protein